MSKGRVFLISVTVCVFSAFFIASYQARKNTVRAESLEAPPALELLIKPHSPITGSPNAKVTLVEFLDPECEACCEVHPGVKRLLKEYDGKIRLVIRYMPYHRNSYLAAAALEEAREFGKFDEALDILFEKQPEWGDHAKPRPELIAAYLGALGIEQKRLERPYLLTKHQWKVMLDNKDGNELGVRGTPRFFVNGKKLKDGDYESVKKAIDEAMAQ